MYSTCNEIETSGSSLAKKCSPIVRGTVASWLVLLTQAQTVRFRALSGETVLCSWASHCTLTLPLSTQPGA